MLTPILLLDGAETWIVTANLERELTTTFNNMVRSSLRVTTHTTWKNHTTTEELLDKMGLNSLAFYLDWKLLSCAGHVQRMGDHRLPRTISNSAVAGKCRSGGQHKKKSTQALTALKRCGMDINNWKDLAQDRAFWNTRIKSASLRKLHGAKSKQLRWTQDPVVAKPESALGRCVEKKFRNQWHVGVISDWDEDANNYCAMWRITCEDGDVGDCNWNELKPILCPLEDGEYMRNIIDPCECAPAMAMRRTVAKTYGTGEQHTTGKFVDSTLTLQETSKHGKCSAQMGTSATTTLPIYVRFWLNNLQIARAKGAWANKLIW
jgi:hypothetical protein